MSGRRLGEGWMAALVIGFGLLLYLPLAGSYGLWDPWETHYSEVARQMTRRADYISLWWPGSPREGAVFQSKPVLSFWLISLGMRLAGLARPGADPAEMALGHRAEWVARTPFCVLGALALWGIYLVGARLAGRRAGLLSALVAGTCPLYALVTRQAMTDLAFVAPMTLALALGALALWDRWPEPERQEIDDPELPRRGRGLLSWPHHPLFYGHLALLLVATVPQLLVDSIDLRMTLPWRGRLVTMYGAVAMIPYDLGLVAAVAVAARARRRAPLLLMMAGTLCGLAVLGKGLAGLALPGLVFLIWVAVSGGGPILLRRRLVPALLGTLLVAAVVAVPWHHAMIIRHGWAWWNELFGDNHWRRLVMGRHGDRGTFEYFLRELGYGTLPWVALLPAAVASLLTAGTRLAPARRALVALGVVWAVVSYAVVSLSMTKFHHYVLPAVPGLALVLGCFLDERSRDRRPGWALALAGLPLLALVLLDLVRTASAAERFLWLFSYDYVYSPRGRPWPAELDFRPALVAAGLSFAVAAVAFAWPRARRGALVGLGTAAVLFTVFLLDRFMPAVAPAWSLKGTIAAYFQQRRSPAERLVAYRMFWRGETFYTENALYGGPPEDRTLFDGDDLAAVDGELRAWIDRHRGQRHFFLYEPASRARVEALLQAVHAIPTVVDQPNAKFVLERADL
jgi:4-amino-4-deoxy-L-arabinose transferase-like glycosyltransferase